jgi:hypothetical protein
MRVASPSFVFTGVPTFFRCCCLEAAQGGTCGYQHPAYQLASHLSGLHPYGATCEEWQQELDRLSDLLMPVAPENSEPAWAGRAVQVAYLPRDADAVWAWFAEHYPKCMALIPARRRRQFLAGVYRCFEDYNIGLKM